MVVVDQGVIEHKLVIRLEQGDQRRSVQADQGQNSPGGSFPNMDC